MRRSAISRLPLVVTARSLLRWNFGSPSRAAIASDVGSAQHVGAALIEPLAELNCVEADELADLEERDRALGDEAPHERLLHVEHRRDPRKVVELGTNLNGWFGLALDQRRLPTWTDRASGAA